MQSVGETTEQESRLSLESGIRYPVFLLSRDGCSIEIDQLGEVTPPVRMEFLRQENEMKSKPHRALMVSAVVPRGS